MSVTTPSVTIWNRLEPRPRSPAFKSSLTAELRDPLWLLARQWQVGEFQGEDAGSPAFAQYSVTSSNMTGWVPAATPSASPTPLDQGVPLERQALAEGFAPSLTTRVELSQTFEALLGQRLSAASTVARVLAAFRAISGYVLASPADEPFNPLDNATKRFLLICEGRVLDGSALLTLAASIAAGGSLPSGLANDASEDAAIRAALSDLQGWAKAVYGDFQVGDPAAWRPDLIEYGVKVTTATPEGGSATLSAIPDETGEFQWSSFDIDTVAATPAATPVTQTKTIIPTHVRFMGMPAPRFWDFESNELSFADVRSDKKDILKALVADFMLIHGVDWFEFGIEQPTGTLVRLDYVVVTDVFGGRTLVERADKEVQAPGTTRWTMFSNTRSASGTTAAGLGNFLAVPPSAGASLVMGPALEEVRFARDEMANMAFGVERATMSPLGEARPGGERNAAVDQRAPVTTEPPADTTAPLHYLIESKVPVQYIPLVAVPLAPNDATNPAIILEKAAIVRTKKSGGYDLVLATGRILNPTSISGGEPYRILEEQIPRSGVTVRRAVYRARWRDGSTHLWIARRKQTGAGETQTGLRFDAAMPVKT
jgi:hypothetical protein